ncbi:MAG: hypothetical protein HS111_32330 [Kofleriaceae bacterium]|nr:hypothetical protein [Kofleriaceae bacterium]
MVSLCLTLYKANVNRVYFADLAGAAAAALVAGLTLRLLGGPDAVLLICALAAGGHLLAPRRLGWAPAVVVLAVIAVNQRARFITVPSTKGVASEKVAFEQWNIFSRITVDKGLNVKIDASAATDPQPGQPEPGHADARGDGAGPRQVPRRRRARARHRPRRRPVTSCTRWPPAPATSPASRSARSSRRRSCASASPTRPGACTTTRGCGSSSMTTAATCGARPERFDVLQASLVDTFAATAAGAFALSENTLYTVEAFTDYGRAPHRARRGDDDPLAHRRRWPRPPASSS